MDCRKHIQPCPPTQSRKRGTSDAPELEFLTAHIRLLGRRLRQEDDGYTTETIVVTALLVALALAVLAVIAVRVRAKANSINP